MALFFDFSALLSIHQLRFTSLPNSMLLRLSIILISSSRLPPTFVFEDTHLACLRRFVPPKNFVSCALSYQSNLCAHLFKGLHACVMCSHSSVCLLVSAIGFVIKRNQYQRYKLIRGHKLKLSLLPANKIKKQIIKNNSLESTRTEAGLGKQLSAPKPTKPGKLLWEDWFVKCAT